MKEAVIRYILLLIGCFIHDVVSAQINLRVNGEVELMGTETGLDSILVRITNDNQVVAQTTPSKKGLFTLKLNLNAFYQMSISKEGFYEELIDINTTIEDSLIKIWPVYLKVRLRPDSLPQIIVPSLISFDSVLSRFEHKNIGNPILVPKKISNSTKNLNNEIQESDTLEKLRYTYEELKKMKELKDLQAKSNRGKQTQLDYKQHQVELGFYKRKLEMLSRQIEERIAQKKRVNQNLNINLLKEYEYELQTKVTHATKKRKLIEEIAETNKFNKIKERKSGIDE